MHARVIDCSAEDQSTSILQSVGDLMNRATAAPLVGVKLTSKAARARTGRQTALHP